MFDEEELEILEAFENDKVKRAKNAEEELLAAKKSAKEYLSKSKNITLRLRLKDLQGIKEKSKDIGIPYQTLINSLIHQFVDGKIKLNV